MTVATRRLGRDLEAATGLLLPDPLPQLAHPLAGRLARGCAPGDLPTRRLHPPPGGCARDGRPAQRPHPAVWRLWRAAKPVAATGIPGVLRSRDDRRPPHQPLGGRVVIFSQPLPQLAFLSSMGCAAAATPTRHFDQLLEEGCPSGRSAVVP
ncbi:hypothetical protein LFM09_28105 [Lentzea alba]|uniref:hypothetical protein n=1 Tax=Lentzea alba TaxID=2714351 RepID=UPI0039BF497E